eukprot:1158967-Pelagomonas_calceolata.AAC.5
MSIKLSVRCQAPLLLACPPQQAPIVHSTPVSPWTSRQASVADCPLMLQVPEPQAVAAPSAAAAEAALEAAVTLDQALGQQALHTQAGTSIHTHAPQQQQALHTQAGTSIHAHAPQQQQALHTQAGSSKLSNQARAPATQQASYDELHPAQAALKPLGGNSAPLPEVARHSPAGLAHSSSLGALCLFLMCSRCIPFVLLREGRGCFRFRMLKDVARAG